MELEKANNRRVSFPLGSEARRKQPVKPGSPKIRREKGTAAFNNNFSLTGNLWEGSQTGGLTTDFFDTGNFLIRSSIHLCKLTDFPPFTRTSQGHNQSSSTYSE